MFLAFDKSTGSSDNRKKWLVDYDKDSIIENSEKEVKHEDFVNKELIHFSNYDNIRSIPSICDGLKPSQRKILYAGFKKKLFKEIKVSQFAGYVSEHSSYHHGEASLHGAIIGMAQNFVGSNNINLFKPNGQFGTRLLGGKDSASPRYIFTQLNDISTILFNQNDNFILKYLNDDGFKIEPEWYIPIIPLILINGTEGIGTGYSTYVPCYNPMDLVNNIDNLLNDKKPYEMTPWYNGFEGTMIKIDKTSYLCKGKYRIINSKMIEIIELPVGRWIDEYKTFLQGLAYDNKDSKTKKQIVTSFTNHSTESKVKFIIKLKEPIAEKMESKNVESNINELEKIFKLDKKISFNNMNLYDHPNKLKKYSSPINIIEEFYEVRLNCYVKEEIYVKKLKEN